MFSLIYALIHRTVHFKSIFFFQRQYWTCILGCDSIYTMGTARGDPRKGHKGVSSRILAISRWFAVFFTYLTFQLTDKYKFCRKFPTEIFPSIQIVVVSKKSGSELMGVSKIANESVLLYFMDKVGIFSSYFSPSSMKKTFFSKISFRGHISKVTNWYGIEKEPLWPQEGFSDSE